MQEHTAVVERVHARKGLNFRAKNAENAKKRIRKIVKEIRRRHELFFYEYEDDAYEYYEDWGEIWLYSLDKYYGYTGKCNERGVVEIMHELIEFR